ncbi:MAG: c-type cytochrome domain-containing protein, partial [Planctomycetota bacterium]
MTLARGFYLGAMMIGAVLLSSQTPCSSVADDSERMFTDAEQHFLDKVKPLLASRCIGCHGPDEVKGGLRLDSREAALKGGETGPSLVAGKPGDSLFLAAVKHTNPELKMPPKDKLASADIAALERWIKDGAPWPAIKAAASPKETGDKFGDAWTDPRNPIAKLYG